MNIATRAAKGKRILITDYFNYCEDYQYFLTIYQIYISDTGASCLRVKMGLLREAGTSNPHGVDVLLLAPGSTDANGPINQGISRDQLVGVMSPAEVAQRAIDKSVSV